MVFVRVVNTMSPVTVERKRGKASRTGHVNLAAWFVVAVSIPGISEIVSYKCVIDNGKNSGLLKHFIYMLLDNARLQNRFFKTGANTVCF